MDKVENIYKLDWDRSHLVDMKYDVFHAPFPNSERFGACLLNNKEFEVPEKIFFQGNIEILEEIDFLVNNLYTSLFSRRFIELLMSLGDFKHRKINCGIVDYTIPTKEAFVDYEKSLVKDGISLNENFSIIHLLEYSDAFDYENSKYTMRTTRRNSSVVDSTEKIIFKEPKDGFPPIFKIKESRELVLIPESTKNVLESKDIKGLLYTLV